ncbi:uncharacterized protein LOC109845933 [Asparagus officinalis]|uniref:uncharacterized protein LOC109845933 n=1 Tax=Asparagus officinalis TaxID=4686 RepID=UPI00098E3DCA|nr:uncharacterized protein LOC109845933 [Asparagus officinalis]
MVRRSKNSGKKLLSFGLGSSNLNQLVLDEQSVHGSSVLGLAEDDEDDGFDSLMGSTGPKGGTKSKSMEDILKSSSSSKDQILEVIDTPKIGVQARLLCDIYSIQKLHQCMVNISENTGLEANQDKSSVFFGEVVVADKNHIISCLGFKEGTLPIKYLGVPLISKRLSYADCFPLIDKVTNQLQLWLKHKNLSYVGRLQVIKSVVLGVQVFWTSNYILPVQVTSKIDELCRIFLWGKSNESAKTPLVAWDKDLDREKYKDFSGKMQEFGSSSKGY